MKVGKGTLTMTDTDTGEIVWKGRTDGVEFMSEIDKHKIPCHRCGKDIGKVGYKNERNNCNDCLRKVITIRIKI